MKRKPMYRILSLLTAITLVFGTAFLTTEEASAAHKKGKLISETLWANCEYYGGANIEFKNDADYDKAKLVSIKSSNPRVIKAVKDGTGIYDQTLIPKKVGKSKITLKYKLKGKTYTTSAEYKVKKYPSHLKSVKVNGKKINLKNNKYYYVKYNYKKNYANVKYELEKGWKIDYVYGFLSKGDTTNNLKINKKNIKNGSKINFPKKYDFMSIFVVMSNKEGDTIQHSVQFDRAKY